MGVVEFLCEHFIYLCQNPMCPIKAGLTLLYNDETSFQYLHNVSKPDCQSYF